MRDVIVRNARRRPVLAALARAERVTGMTRAEDLSAALGPAQSRR